MTTTNRIIPSPVDLGDDVRGLRANLCRVQTTSAAVAAHDEQFPLRPLAAGMWVRAGSQPEPNTNSSPRNTQSFSAQSGGVCVKRKKKEAVIMVFFAVTGKFQTLETL